MYASAEIRSDPDVVYSAVAYNGLSLQYALPKKAGTPGPKGDKRIVMAAVKQNCITANGACAEFSRHIGGVQCLLAIVPPGSDSTKWRVYRACGRG